MSNMCAVLFLFVILVSEIAGTDQMKSENPNSKQFMNQDFGQYLLNSTESVDIFFALTPTNAEENIVKSPDPKIDWKTTRDGVKWFPNCGFPGYDIKNEYVGGKCNYYSCRGFNSAITGDMTIQDINGNKEGINYSMTT